MSELKADSAREIPKVQRDRYEELLRRLFDDDRGEALRKSRTVALVAAHPGAGVTYVAAAIREQVNLAASRSRMSSSSSRMRAPGDAASRYDEALADGAVMTATVVENLGSSEPARMAVGLDYRKLKDPAASFGDVVAEGLDPELLMSPTKAGERTVQAVLNSLPVEWAEDALCRRECLRIVGGIFKLVLVDVPSLKETWDICTVAPIVDHVIVVVEADRTTRKQLARLTWTIEDAGGKILGYVLNKRTYPIPSILFRCLEKAGMA